VSAPAADAVLPPGLSKADFAQALRAFASAQVPVTGEGGYGLYRGHIDFMDEIAAEYGWGDHAMLRLYGTLKDALDPDGILSPGKQGIWPRATREF
jgi:4-cresol dehydrogenase (hydroxylating)